jgi:allene oxide cyclase-like protein
MSRPTRLGVAAIAALSVASVSVASASVAATAHAVPARHAGPGHHGHGHVVMRITAVTDQFAVIDVGDPGPAVGLGDQIVSSDHLSRSGSPAGRAGTVLTVVGVGPDTLTTQLVSTLALPEGQVVLQGIGDGPTGPPTEPLSFTLAVTGGTGKYREAGGVAHILDLPGGREEITLELAM